MAEARFADEFRRVVARLRARGVTVVEESDCYSRTVGGPVGRAGAKDLLGVESHGVHHTAGGYDDSDRRVVRDGRPGLRGPLAQWLTHTDGTLRLVSAGYANHAGATRRRFESNSWCVGNEIVSRGRSSQDFTPAQVAASKALAEEMAREFDYQLDSWTVGHKEMAVPTGRKVDPAFSMPDFRAGLSVASASPTPTPTTPEEGFLMALTDTQQESVFQAVGRTDEGVQSTLRQVADLRERMEVALGGIQAVGKSVAATRENVGAAARQDADRVAGLPVALRREWARTMAPVIEAALAEPEDAA